MSAAKLTHQFAEKTFHKWTFCDHCNKILWGLIKQGVECTECGFISHKKCLNDLTVPCDHLYSAHVIHEEDEDVSRSIDDDASSDTEISLFKRTAPRHLRLRSNAQSVMRSPSANASSDTVHIMRSPTSPQPYRSSIVQDLIVSTAAKQIELEKSLKPAPLNFFTTTPRNFTRFVARAGVGADLEDNVLYVLSWQSPSVTLLCMVAYTLVCLYPALVLLSPFALLLNIMISNYFARAKRIAKAGGKKALGADPSTAPITVVPPVAQKGSVQYARNLKFIQNSMGMFADTYDAVRTQMTRLDWSNEKHTADIFKATLAGLVGMSIVLLFVPWNYLVLGGGLFAFVANTAVVQAAIDIIVPKVLALLRVEAAKFQKRWLKRRMTDAPPAAEEQTADMKKSKTMAY